MKLLLIGNGKMGKEIALQAQKRGHEIVAVWDKDDEKTVERAKALGAEVLIEFTHPSAVLDNLRSLLNPDIPLVCGTTGWLQELDSIQELTHSRNAGFMYASNFSVGVNILFKLNRQLARLMNPHAQYDCAIEEQHHRFKADAPSGTALSLAQELLEELDRKTEIAHAALTNRPPQDHELSVGFIRSGNIIGTHRVIYTSETDTITLSHEAHSRSGFAVGAVIAAEFIAKQRGFFNFADIF